MTDEYQSTFNKKGVEMKKATKVLSILSICSVVLFSVVLYLTKNMNFIDYIAIFSLNIVFLFNNISFNTEYRVQKILKPKDKNLFWTVKYWRFNLFTTYLAFSTFVYFGIDIISMICMNVVNINGVEFNHKYLTLSLSLVIFVIFATTIKNELNKFNKALNGEK